MSPYGDLSLRGGTAALPPRWKLELELHNATELAFQFGSVHFCCSVHIFNLRCHNTLDFFCASHHRN